jgi:hypothetical protein
LLDRHDPFHSLSRELLVLLDQEGRPMTARALQVRMERGQALRQLSVARRAGFVRAATGVSGTEPAYAPTPLGQLIARRAASSRPAARMRYASEPLVELA